MKIIGDGFILRPFERTDKTALAKHGNNKNIADYMRDVFPHPYYEENAVAFIEFVLQNKGSIRNFIIEINNEAAGAISILPKEDIYKMNVEIGYWLGETHWRKGIMTSVIKKIVEYTFNTFEVNRIQADVFSTNPASMKALEKAGFVKEGILRKAVVKNGNIFDLHVYSVVKE